MGFITRGFICDIPILIFAYVLFWGPIKGTLADLSGEYNYKAREHPVEPRIEPSTWRFIGSYTWGYKSPNMGYKYSYPTNNPTYHYPYPEPEPLKEPFYKDLGRNL